MSLGAPWVQIRSDARFMILPPGFPVPTGLLTVARWEAKPVTSIPGTSDRALRLFFALKMEGDGAATGLLDMLADIDEAEYGDAVFEEAGGDWHFRRAA